MITLYDTPADLVAKALRGLGETPAGLPPQDLKRFLKGAFDPDTARRLAGPLGLDAAALARFPDPRPETALPPGVARLELPFEDETVNAWCLENGDTPLVIDAGLGRTDLAAALPGKGTIDLLITHPHRDHIGGIAGVEKRIRGFWSPVPLDRATPVRPGDRWRLGELEILVFDLAGHHPDAIGYRINGFGPPLLAVGDAVFAQSAGGCPGPQAYRQARSTLTRALVELPDETLLLTGHGWATTLGLEKDRNPFLAAWLSAADGGP